MTIESPRAVDLAAASLERIATLDANGSPTALRSVLALAEDAMGTAAGLDVERARGRVRGPLHGLPILIKDNIEAVGLPGSAGSMALQGRTVLTDSPVVTRLRAAGANIIGSTNLSEWANFRSPRSTSGWSAVGGLTGNPWALDRSAGGSSSGSGAAVAAGITRLAVGTETNGSITCPAALNGVVGLKPTVGSVPMRGIVPISASQDVAGALARTVSEAALLYEVMSGRVDCLVACSPDHARTLAVGIVQAWLTGDARTDEIFARAVRTLEGHVASVRPTTVPVTPPFVHADQVSVLIGEIGDDLDAYLAGRPGAGVHSVADVIAFNINQAAQELAAFGQEYLVLAQASGGRAAPAYLEARERNVTWARDECLGPALAAGFDVLIAPAYRPARTSDLTYGDAPMSGGEVCTPAAILGWPILTVPMGLVDGLPVGLAIVGPAGSEPSLLAIGSVLEQALGLEGAGALEPAWRTPSRG